MTPMTAVRPWPDPGPLPRPQDLAPGPRLWLVRAPGPGAPPDESVLDDEERRRADSLRRPADRALYVAAHVALRRALGGCLGLPAARVPLTRLPCPGCGGPHGRPAVAGPYGAYVHFSLSHTGGLALLGLAARPVGVDVERVPEERLVEDAAGALHPAEQEELAGAAPDTRALAFARCWTRKEAYLKAIGEGLSGDGLRTVRLGTGPAPAGLPGWLLSDVEVPPGYAAACALPEPGRMRTQSAAPESRPSSPAASSVRQHR
ncbi:4'-phosphopantetheinyl transferase family protein [Streptomyces sclerotialus]|uniref:4'-phosphopantetheinyl transferase family protein n=1 Tax=Streptomyces sclerotialus TaxID=1957 RepID=UPI0007C4A42D